jgi:RNA-directed DNA polymerase
MLPWATIEVNSQSAAITVMAFLKAGILTELGEEKDTPTGTPQGGILSPLLANIALSVLDGHVHAPWRPGGAMSISMRRQTRRKKGLPNWRIVRYADDFVILVHGTQDDAHALREDVAAVLAPMGLRLSPTKTSVRNFSDGFDFLGFHIRWRRKAGANKWYVYTFIADRPVKALKAKLRALTHRTSQADLGATLIKLNQILHAWATHLRHAVATHTFRARAEVLAGRLPEEADRPHMPLPADVGAAVALAVASLRRSHR